jgi:hypothetical protein
MEEWFKQNLPEVWEKEVWPPSSPNYSLLDFFVRGVSELLVNAKLRNRIKDLIQKMKVGMEFLDRDFGFEKAKKSEFSFKN